jgi:NTE family protein
MMMIGFRYGMLQEHDWISVWNATRTDNKESGEAARRYYSAKEFLYSGAPKVFSHFTKENDERFYDNFWPVTNEWYR